MKKCFLFLLSIVLIGSSLVGCTKQTLTPTPAPEKKVVVTAEPAKAVIAGKDSQRIAKITVKESSPGSLSPNGTIIFTLPSQTRFSSDPSLNLVGGSGIWATASAKPVLDNREVAFTLAGTVSSDIPAELELANVDIDVAPNIYGPIKIAVTGTAGATGECIVAQCAQMVSMTADVPPVRIGIQNQAAGDIVITESVPEAIASISEHKQIQIIAPRGVKFSAVPKVDVTAGNLRLGNISLSPDNGRILINTAGVSTAASTITVSAVKITVDRTVPEGDIEVIVSGSALIQNNPSYFPNATSVGQVVIAKVITPAGDSGRNTAVFKVGSNSYTLNGTSQSMEAAPYKDEDRLFVPLRDAAHALGIDDNSIIWDQNNQSVTLMKGNKVVQVTIGSQKLLINNSLIMMDVTPKLVSGRVMLPIGWMAQVFSATVIWDEANQTATVSY